jgi:hypothetical protein
LAASVADFSGGVGVSDPPLGLSPVVASRVFTARGLKPARICEDFTVFFEVVFFIKKCDRDSRVHFIFTGQAQALCNNPEGLRTIYLYFRKSSSSLRKISSFISARDFRSGSGAFTARPWRALAFSAVFIQRETNRTIIVELPNRLISILVRKLCPRGVWKHRRAPH